MNFTAVQAKQSNYTCAALSFAILLTRVIVAKYRKRPLDLSLFLVLVSIVVIIARIIVVYYLLIYGTAGDALGDQHYFDLHDDPTIKKGSILSLVARCLILASCWLQICLLLLFYGGMMSSIPWVVRMIRLTWAATIGTFVAVVLATFLECRPIHLYWQVDPDPGNCIKGYVQLFIQSISNIVLDVMLLIITYPILDLCKNRSRKQQFSIGVLFILGTFCIIVTILRTISIVDSSSAQPTRSVWASVQMTVSTFVANVPTIYGDLQLVKRKKTQDNLRRESYLEPSSPVTEASIPLAPLHIRSSNGSCSSGPKDWFDHIENV